MTPGFLCKRKTFREILVKMKKQRPKSSIYIYISIDVEEQAPRHHIFVCWWCQESPGFGTLVFPTRSNSAKEDDSTRLSWKNHERQYSTLWQRTKGNVKPEHQMPEQSWRIEVLGSPELTEQCCCFTQRGDKKFQENSWRCKAHGCLCLSTCAMTKGNKVV